MSQVHVKFLGNLQKDFYLLINEVDDVLLPPSAPMPHHLNIIKERDIYMRAALQLLDQKNLVPSANDGHHLFGSQDIPSSSAKPPHDDNYMHDVIRLGYLKKGARSGSMNIPGSGAHWKRKYVEVRHGMFTYDDYYGGTIYIGNSDLEELTRSDNYHRRSIKLNVDTCRCRMLPSRDGQPESKVFEIAIKDGVKRLWLASSVEECREWVKAINSAMVGGVYKTHDPNKILPPRLVDEMDGFVRSSARSDASVDFFHMQHSGQDVEKIVIERNFSEDPSDERGGGGHGGGGVVGGGVCVDQANVLWSSIDGAAAPYVVDMSTFLQLQEAFLSCKDESSYRHILYSLYRDRTRLTIPVLFIKGKTTHSNFILSAQDTLSTQNIRSKCSSQVWKDLQRDIIVVNGEQISGELGAESMLGALVRHLNDKADALRHLQDKQKPKDQQDYLKSRHLGDAASKRDSHATSSASGSSNANTNGNGNANANKSLTSVDFSITEAQIVECAKDLLVLCNRTQSGGDTYFCIEAFLSGDYMKEFCILTPYSASAEPLEFLIDVVEVSQHLSPAARRQQRHHPNQPHHPHLNPSQQQQQSISQTGGGNAALSVSSSSSASASVASSSLHHHDNQQQQQQHPSHVLQLSSSRSGYDAGASSVSLDPEGRFGGGGSSHSHGHGHGHHRYLPSHRPSMQALSDTEQGVYHGTDTPHTPTSHSRQSPILIPTAPSTGDFHGLPSATSTAYGESTPSSTSDSRFLAAALAGHATATPVRPPLPTSPTASSSSSKYAHVPLPMLPPTAAAVADGQGQGLRKKSFTFDDADVDRQPSTAAHTSRASAVARRVEGTTRDVDAVTATADIDDNADGDDQVLVDQYDNDDNGDDDLHEKYRAARSSHNKRTALRLSGSGAGSLGLRAEDLQVPSGSRTPPALQPPAVSTSTATTTTTTTMSTTRPSITSSASRRAQLDLKRELQEEGYLNSIWNTDGTTNVKLTSSVAQRIQQQQHQHQQSHGSGAHSGSSISSGTVDYPPPLLHQARSVSSPWPTSGSVSTSSSRPPSLTRVGPSGVAIGFLDLSSTDANDEDAGRGVTVGGAKQRETDNGGGSGSAHNQQPLRAGRTHSQDSITVTAHASSSSQQQQQQHLMTAGLSSGSGSGTVSGTASGNNSRPASSSLPPLPPPSGPLSSSISTTATVVQSHHHPQHRLDDASVISELTFDTAPRFGHGNASASASSSHHHYPQTQHPPTVYGSHRPLSGGTTTMSSSGQASPGTNSQRTSGQHDAITSIATTTTTTTTTMVVAAGGGPTATTTLNGSGGGGGGGIDGSGSGMLSDGEEYGILDDDEGHDSTNSATYGGGGKHGIGMGGNGEGGASSTNNANGSNNNNNNNNSKKKSLLKRIGKKLRPFKMPQLSSSGAAGGGGGVSGPDTPLPAGSTQPQSSSLSSSFDALKSPFRSSHAAHHHGGGTVDESGPPISRSRSQSDAAAPTAFLSTSKDHFQQFLQHLTPRHHNSHHHHHNNNNNHSHHHNDSDREYSTNHHHPLSSSSRSTHGNGSHHKSHRHHHHHTNGSSHGNGPSSASQPPPPPHLYGAGSGSFLGTTGDGPVDVCASLPVRYGLRIQVRAVCRYRVCAANPTGFVDEDSWATLTGTFHQSFLLVGDGRSQLGITDRLVTIEVDGCTAPLTTAGGNGTGNGNGNDGGYATYEGEMMSSPVTYRTAPFSIDGGHGGYATPK